MDGDERGSGRSDSDRDQFARWFELYHDRVLAQCVRMLGDRAAAEDVTQETLLRAWVGRDQMREEDLGGWLTVVARNLCISHIRRQKRAVPTEILPETPDETADPAHVVERLESRRAVRRAMRQVGDRHRKVLQLREIEEVDYEDLGSELGLSPSGTRAVLFRARRVLRDRLAAVGEGLAAIAFGLKVRLRDLRVRARGALLSTEAAGTQAMTTGLNFALGLTLTLSSFGGSAATGAALGLVFSTHSVPAALSFGPTAGQETNARTSVTRNQDRRSANKAILTTGRGLPKPRVETTAWDEDDGSQYIDVDIAGNGFTLEGIRQPDDHLDAMYRVEDEVMPKVCRHTPELCGA